MFLFTTGRCVARRRSASGQADFLAVFRLTIDSIAASKRSVSGQAEKPRGLPLDHRHNCCHMDSGLVPCGLMLDLVCVWAYRRLVGRLCIDL